MKPHVKMMMARNAAQNKNRAVMDAVHKSPALAKATAVKEKDVDRRQLAEENYNKKYRSSDERHKSGGKK